MSTRLYRWRPGLLVALLALAAHLVLGGAAPEVAIRATPEQQLAALLADPAAICHGDASGDRQAPHHHAIDCALCPYCAALTAAAVLPSDNPTPPILRAGPIAVAMAASPAATLPTAPRRATSPRGPPILA